LDDLVVKQSHTIAPTHTSYQPSDVPPTASFAWGETKKQSKISLDFK